jgi:rare lipoprotein A
LIVVLLSGLTSICGAHAQGRIAAPLQAFFANVSVAPAAVSAASSPLLESAAAGVDRQIVRASWYGGGERLSAHTSSGDLFRPMAQTAAHRTLPFGTMLRVSSLVTGRSTIVRINDRGPAAYTGRALDLSRGAAIALGVAGMGESKVAIEVIR